ncbi:oligosaccharide flippase family protein [Altererythrobacter sp. MF3-039]|uniref:oligosaccharide flippase family protein n=1 Tax=Altererythrobacter sp. MF3-039 TaxID=3252901 RepID=UPI00390C991F
MVLVFASHILLARSLSAEEYGFLAYSFELIGLVAVLAGLGMANVAVQVVPDYRINRDGVALRRFLRMGIAISVGGVAIAAVVLGVYWRADFVPDDYPASLLIATIFSLAAMVLLRFVQEIMRGLRRIASAQVVEQLAWPTVLTILALLQFMALARFSVPEILIFQALLLTAGFGLLASHAIRSLPVSDLEVRPAKEAWRDVLAVGLPLAGSASLTVFLNRGDVIALGALATPQQLGYYAAAARVAGLALFGLAAANAASAPLMREFWTSQSRAELQSIVGRTAAIATWFSLPLVLICVLVPREVLSVFGDDFLEAAPALRVLAAGQFINALTGPVGPMLVAASRGRIYLAFTALAAILMIAMLLVLVPIFGLLGAALSAAGSIALLNAMLAAYAWKMLGVRTIALPSDLAATGREVTVLISSLIRRLAGKKDAG